MWPSKARLGPWYLKRLSRILIPTLLRKNQAYSIRIITKPSTCNSSLSVISSAAVCRSPRSNLLLGPRIYSSPNWPQTRHLLPTHTLASRFPLRRRTQIRITDSSPFVIEVFVMDLNSFGICFEIVELECVTIIAEMKEGSKNWAELRLTSRVRLGAVVRQVAAITFLTALGIRELQGILGHSMIMRSICGCL